MTDQPQPLDLDAIERAIGEYTEGAAAIAEIRRLTAKLATMTAVAESNKRYVQSMYQDLQQAKQQTEILADVRAQLDAVRTWVANTIHGRAAAEVGALVGQRPMPVEYCGYCHASHTDCRC